jgi:hypothetical protein
MLDSQIREREGLITLYNAYCELYIRNVFCIIAPVKTQRKNKKLVVIEQTRRNAVEIYRILETVSRTNRIT